MLTTNIIISLKQLRIKLGDRPRSSLFRDLKKLDLISSYTHSGQYHALKSTATFDKNGFWFFQNVGFSEHGTLKNTLVHTISHAKAGMTHGEMKKLVCTQVQKPLTNLVNSHAVTRQLLPSRIYVYLSVDESKAQEQFQRRLAISDKIPNANLPTESIRIEVLLEVIHTPGRALDEKELGAFLRKRNVIIKDDEVACVLTYYDIKKN